MIINKFVFLSKHGYDNLEKSFLADNQYIIEIDGREVQSRDAFFRRISEKFFLPEIISSWSIFDDYMRSFLLLQSIDSVILIFWNFDCMLYNDKISKINLIESFTECILPFWEFEVLNTVVGGKQKSFQVYAITEE